ncbi:uncharacterized protein LOC131852557 [Achroia grisella]|uniref:uncharacterized protein LOC131852557 n=1 Tax=Achroia grisella TaxID=688607 RepID=UPI0027D29919|nr:uncharacterized protein LOC131852557 [Achroia grisella]
MAESKKHILQGGTTRKSGGESSTVAPGKPGAVSPMYLEGATEARRGGVVGSEREVMVVLRRDWDLDRRSRSECDEAEYYMERSDSSLSLYSEDGAVGGGEPSTSRASLRKRRMIEVEVDPDLTFDEEVEVVEVVATPRPKQRPPPTRDPDLEKAKADLAAATRREMETKATPAPKKASAPKSAARPTTRRPSDEDAQRADVLVSEIKESALKVLEAVRKSGHLKGTVVKEIKDAVATIRAASESLDGRTASTECAALRRENSRLSRDLADMREMMTAMREESAKYYVELRDLKRKTMGSAAQSSDELAMLKAERAEWEREIAATRNSFEELMKKSSEDRLALSKAQSELAAAKVALANQPQSAAMDVTSGAQGVESSETPPITEGAEARIVRQIGDIFNARFERIEELVGRTQKPPPKKTTAAPRTPGAAKKGGSTAPVASTSGAGVSASQPAPSSSEQWTTVVRRGKRASAAKGQQSAPATQAPTGGAKTGQKKATTEAESEATRRKRARKRQFRPPRSSAVVLTLQPGAEEAGSSYSSVLREAQQKIQLDALGITELGFRLAITGSRILEVPGPVEESGGKADALAAKLAEVLPAGVVSVSRPVKSAEFRILDLDDATTAAEVVAAVAREGDCAEASVKTGEIRRSPSGSGSIWVRCPVGAVKRLVDAGKLRVGWTMARVRSLDPRPMRCFRCLLTGHVGQRCTAKEDRGGACFRCGQDGHKAASCTAPSPHCPYCAAAKKKADHRMGSTKGCRPAKVARVEEMEAESGPSPPTTGLAAADAGASAVT